LFWGHDYDDRFGEELVSVPKANPPQATSRAVFLQRDLPVAAGLSV